MACAGMLKRILVAAVLLLLLAAAGIAGWAWVGLNKPFVAPPGESLTLVTVDPGETWRGLMRRLVSEGRVENLSLVRAYLRVRHPGRQLSAGEYEIPAGEPLWRVLDRLVAGHTLQRSFTLVEGWNFRQVRAALAAEPRLRQTLKGLDDRAVMAKLGKAQWHPEGRFAPDTFFYSPRVSTDIDILRRSFAEQERRLAEAWSGRDDGLPYRSETELLTMASIVEKETGQARERPDIAGVFVRRLLKGMLLQTDPTVIYGLGDTYRGNLTREHLRTPTPYNTYLIAGLPPTPIAMPGREALQAAAHPASGDALYFVARGDGTHQFSATIGEHNAAVREFQLRRRSGYRSAPAGGGN